MSAELAYFRCSDEELRELACRLIESSGFPKPSTAVISVFDDGPHSKAIHIEKWHGTRVAIRIGRREDGFSLVHGKDELPWSTWAWCRAHPDVRSALAPLEPYHVEDFHKHCEELCNASRRVQR